MGLPINFLDRISDEPIDTILEFADPLPGPFSAAFLEPMGEAINAVDATATAYSHRDAADSFGIAAGWSDPDGDGDLFGWAREFHGEMAPHATGGVRSNSLDGDEDDRVRAAFPESYERLVDLKNRWDPDTLFRLNQNVEPTA